MSCYMCSKMLIADVARALTSDGPTGFKSYIKGTDAETYFGDMTTEEAYNYLWDMNMDSVHQRYGDEICPAPEYQAIDAENFDQTVENLHCLCYQSAETYDYSDALKSLEDLMDKLPEPESGDWDWGSEGWLLRQLMK